jgi:flagellar hook-length control protein FliK
MSSLPAFAIVAPNAAAPAAGGAAPTATGDADLFAQALGAVLTQTQTAPAQSAATPVKDAASSPTSALQIAAQAARAYVGAQTGQPQVAGAPVIAAAFSGQPPVDPGAAAEKSATDPAAIAPDPAPANHAASNQSSPAAPAAGSPAAALVEAMQAAQLFSGAPAVQAPAPEAAPVHAQAITPAMTAAAPGLPVQPQSPVGPAQGAQAFQGPTADHIIVQSGPAADVFTPLSAADTAPAKFTPTQALMSAAASFPATTPVQPTTPSAKGAASAQASAPAVQTLAGGATAAALAARANLKSHGVQTLAPAPGQAKTSPAAVASGPVSAAAGLKSVLTSNQGQVSPAAVTGITDLLKQASATVTGGPGTTQAKLADLTQQLNRLEARTTGVDPSAPPAGWTEPPAFAQTRALLSTLLGGSAPAPAAKVSGNPLAMAGLPLASAQPEATPSAASAAQPAPSQTAPAAQIAAAVQSVQADKAVSAPPPAAHMFQAASGPAPGPLDAAKTAQPPPAPRAAPEPEARPVETAQSASAPAPEASATPPSNDVGPLSQSLSQSQPQAASAPQDASKPADRIDTPPLETQARVAVQAPVQPQIQAPDPAAVAQTAPDVSHLATQATAYLAGQMATRLNGRATQFDIELHPADLGRVDVQMRIEQDGRLNAQLAFDNPAAAAEFRGRADELRQQLVQAGFQLTDDSLSFTNRNTPSTPQGWGQGLNHGGQGLGQGGQGAGWAQPDSRTRAFQDSDIAMQSADSASTPTIGGSSGLDMRV